MSKRPHRRESKLLPDPAPVASFTWAIPLLLILVTILALFPLCGFDFTTWDDTANVANNELLNPPTLANLWACWTKPQLAIYIPLTYTVWSIIALVARTDTPDPSGIWLNPNLFHTANLAAHIVAVVMVYFLLRRLVGKAWPAAIGAVVFAVHPLQVEPVGWVAGMKDVLCGMLSIAALWQLVSYAQTEPRRKLHYTLATVAYGLALLSKPSAMSLPILAVLLARFMCRMPWKQVAITVGPWFLMAVPIGIIAKVVQPVATIYDGGKVWLRPLIATDALAFYVYKLLLPVQLAVQYDHYPEIVIGRKWLYITWIVPAVLAIVALLLARKHRWVAVGMGLIVAATLPVLGLVPFQYERLSVVADHYMYVAMLGPALIVTFAVTLIPRRVAIVASVLVLAGMTIWSNVQTRHWRDTDTLFRHELDVNPRSFAGYNSLASWEIMHGRPQQAADYAQNAVDIRPDFAEAWGTLGGALSALNRPHEAAAAFKRAYDFAPGNETAAIAASHYGAAMASIGNRVEGEQYLRKAIELNPQLDEAHLNLAVLLVNTGRGPEALAQAEEAVRLGPANPQNHLTLAILLDQSGQRNRAITEFQRTLKLAPNSAVAKRGIQGPLNSAPPRR